MTNTTKDTKKHAVFSASGSERWMLCPGSAKLGSEQPEQPASKWAAEGTKAHELLELIITALANGEPVPEPGDDLTMYNHCTMAANYIFNEFQRSGDELVVEQKVLLPCVSKKHGEQFGTVDAAISETFGTLRIYDFKYGAGKVVDVKDNSQLIYYALGIAALNEYAYQDIELCIIQPRAEGDKIKTHRMSMEELESWRDRFQKAITLAESKKGENLFITGSHCHWCPAKDVCPKQSAIKNEKLKNEFDEVAEAPKTEAKGTLGKVITLPWSDITKLSDDDLASILDKAKAVTSYLKAAEEEATSRLKSGGSITGWKLEPTRAMRKWNDIGLAVKEAKRIYGAKAFSEPELLSPAQFEKKVSDASFLDVHCISVSSGVKLVADDTDKLITSF